MITSVLQALVFHIESHPGIPGFTQCLTRNAFPAKWMELAYNAATLCGFYFIPLGFIIVCYTSILRNMDSVHRQSMSLNKSLLNHVTSKESKKGTANGNLMNVKSVTPEGQHILPLPSSSSSKNQRSRSSTRSTDGLKRTSLSSLTTGSSCCIANRLNRLLLRFRSKKDRDQKVLDEEEVFVRDHNYDKIMTEEDLKRRSEMDRKDLLLRRLASLDPLPSTTTFSSPNGKYTILDYPS